MSASKEMTRVTANLTQRSTKALGAAMEVTRDCQTDVINHSVQVYAYIQQAMKEGNQIIIENPTTGARERLVLL